MAEHRHKWTSLEQATMQREWDAFSELHEGRESQLKSRTRHIVGSMGIDAWQN